MLVGGLPVIFDAAHLGKAPTFCDVNAILVFQPLFLPSFSRCVLLSHMDIWIQIQWVSKGFHAVRVRFLFPELLLA